MLLRGVSLLGDTVRITLALKGRNALAIDRNGVTVFTKDAEVIAQEIGAGESVPDMAVRVRRDAPSRIKVNTGDGFATIIVLRRVSFARD